MRNLLWLNIAAITCLACAPKQAVLTPEATVRAFVDAVGAKDVRKASTFVLEGMPDGGAEATFISEMPPVFEVRGLKAATNGTEATATYVLLVPGVLGTTMEQKDEASLKFVSGSWKIVPDIERKSLLTAMAYLFAKKDTDEVLQSAKRRAEATQCVSNLKDIAVGAILYIADHDDVIAMTPENCKKRMAQYVGNDRLWVCPSAKAIAYSMNPNLSGKHYDDIKSREKTVLFYEGKGGKLDFRHDGKASVALLDMHVESVTQAQASRLKWKAKD